MQKNVISPSLDDFYFMSRTTLVKDEANFDKFDRAFAEFWQGVETIPGIESQIPLEWLLKRVDRDLAGLTALLDRLDRASLAAQRRITVPFLRQTLEQR